jgi:hypothetical protein
VRARKVLYREFWGATKRADLTATLETTGPAFDAAYTPLTPSVANAFSMRRGVGSQTYEAWPTLRDLSVAPDWSGLLEMRRGALVAFDEASLRDRMTRYADSGVPFSALKAMNIGPVEDVARFDAVKARANLLAAGGLRAGRIARIALYPFDNRWCFHSDIRPLWNEPRPDVAAQQEAGNCFLVVRLKARKPDEGWPSIVTRALPGYHLLDPNTHLVPFVIHDVAPQDSLRLHAGATLPNLSPAATAWLAKLGLPATAETSRQVWHHALAIAYSPAWLAENEQGIRQGWPRIPLPDDAGLLAASARLGARVAALLDPDTPLPGVDAGTPDPALAAIAVPSTAPGATRDWTLTGWGHRSAAGITMPGRGRTDTRPYSPAEAATASHAELLGATTRDVWMNGASFWRNIPEAVWETHIGGYQVLKKWLSYRDGSILRRPLTEAEIGHVQATARRLAALRLMGPALDASFRASAAAHAPLPSGAGLSAGGIPI